MRLAIIFIFMFSASNLAFAQTREIKTTNSQSLFLELNAQKQVGPNCQVSFVLQNKLNVVIRQFSFELVIFNEKQQVAKLLILKSGELPIRKTKVKRYSLKTMNCQKISRFLVNDIKQCDADGFTPKRCLQSLVISNKTPSKFGS